MFTPMFLENWQILPCIQRDRFPPIWVCCVGECKGKIIKTGSISTVVNEHTVKDIENNVYNLEKLNNKHIGTNPLRWTHIPLEFDAIITEYLSEELKVDSLATQLVQSYYYKRFNTEK